LFVNLYINNNNLVRVIDDYAAQKLRQIESKYPAINTPTEEVVNTFNEKTEPVRNVMNSMKDTTSSTIQHGKDTVRENSKILFIYLHIYILRFLMSQQPQSTRQLV
jgi:hypothetical protein